MRQVLRDTAVCIDHIGSTSIPDLPAKDIIDMQVTVADLDDPAIVEKLVGAGYEMRLEYGRDEYIGISNPDSLELRKRYCREPEGQRRTNIHIRQDGRFNQRYPLLFRDYLRAHPIMRDGYALIKMRLAEIFPDSIEGYLYIKDPLMDMLFAAVQEWAQATNWQPDEAYR
ncbi:MAG: hypothetical protein BroJett015_20280 [Chloroflexota bacterium]|nr:MAG: hypothetical protein BroJett015_20280 [Chloroflexota bacterium]